MRILHSIKYDIMSQYKNGIYFVYSFISIIYILVLQLIPNNFTNSALVFLIFSDPTFLGFFFVGAMVLLERNQGIPLALFITPLTLEEYIISKCISLSLISVIVSLIITFTVKGAEFNIILLTSVVLVNSIIFTLIGLITGMYSKTLNHYFLIATLVGVVIAIPLLNYFKVTSFRPFNLFPTYIAIALIEGAIYKSEINIIYFLISIIWAIVLYDLAKVILRNKFV
ncbi:putative membrane protein [Clostridium argentinense CDC 2741]|uniref:Putative membrane protein n=1 Tax=Clostridium argentinense CDC 2741 TaxID=1418104 RepID=A0A0C1TY41_9CLOT|nr:hypothetical protein [Clostridium argentinense]ARC86732.1 hypothetical protein RSJ17_20675 [Clostridium argentinense]KIE45624.1 putative membrane protein [Clostridium argentinense CDC 2741]NFF38477.1 hypothetical protein [Clostridium argentinense]NFP49330.1 hypothetical protein [Clostridium argentinense]NFP71733.1 hypothetical protein [Clostridium argentinense]